MYTLHHAAEIRTIDQIEELRDGAAARSSPAEMKLAKQVDRELRGRAEPEGLQGRIQGRPAQDHRREGGGRGDRRRRSRGAAAQGRGPDGSAAQEPRRRSARARRSRRRPNWRDRRRSQGRAEGEPPRRRQESVRARRRARVLRHETLETWRAASGLRTSALSAIQPISASSPCPWPSDRGASRAA